MRLRWTGIAWGLAGIVAATVFVTTYRDARPEAALDLQVGRAEALDAAREFLRERSVDLTLYREAIGFFTDNDAKSYLEKELSHAEANQLMAGEVVPWYWYIRFFVPQQEVEHRFAIAPDGRLIYYYHHMPEDAPAPRTSPEVARSAAEAFIANHMRRDIASFRLVENSDVTYTNRREFSYTWEKKNTTFAEATLRIDATATGGQITRVEEYLHIPEAWQREQARQRDQRGFLTTLASYGQTGLYIAAIVLLFTYLGSHRLRFRPVLHLSMLMLLIPLLEGINAIPSSWLQYDTASSIWAFYGALALSIGQSMLNGPLLVLIAAAPAITLAHDLFPKHPPLEALFTRRFWYSRGVFTAAWVGIALAALHCAFYNVFYLVGGDAGVWSPQSTPFLDALGMPFPWIEALSVGFNAAVNEELVFRLLGISLLLRITRSKLIAVIVPAIIWGFLHSTYPQEPVYIRGVELSLVGIFYGVVFLRYGVLATFLSHFAYNAIAAAAFLLQSGNIYAAVSGGIVVALTAAPLVPGILRITQGKALHVYPPPTPRPQRPKAPPPAPVDPPVPMPPIPGGRLAFCLLCAAALACTAFLPAAPRHGDHVRVEVDWREAVDAADAWLTARGFDTEGFKRQAGFATRLNGDECDYIWQQRGLEGLRDVYQRRFTARPAWYVRYFKPLEEESYNVYLDTRGEVLYHLHRLSETAPGASLSQDEARDIALQYLSDHFDIDPERWNLVFEQASERIARVDHTFTWEDNEEHIAEANFRRDVTVAGDEPMDGNLYLEVPEVWERARGELRIWDIAGTVVMLTCASIFALFGVMLLYRLIISQIFQFRHAAVLALFAFAFTLASRANLMPWFWGGYHTSGDPDLYLLRRGLHWFIAEPLGNFFAAACLIAFADAAYRHAFPKRATLAQWFGLSRMVAGYRSRAWGHALLLGCATGLACFGVESLFKSISVGEDLETWQPSVHDSAPAATIHGGGVAWSAAVDAMTSLGPMFFAAFATLLLAAAVHRYLRTPTRRLCIYLPAAAALVFVGAATWVEALQLFPVLLLGIILCAITVGLLGRHLYRDNLPALLLTALIAPFPHLIASLYATPQADAQEAARILGGVFAGFFALGLLLSATAPKPSPPQPNPQAVGDDGHPQSNATTPNVI